jgi:CheY-like chemotaxis protein
VCLGKPFQLERKLACDIQNKAKVPAMISKLDRWCNWDNKNRPAIATRISSLSSLLLEDIDSPTKQWFADNLRHLPLPLVTPNAKVESSAYPGELFRTFLRKHRFSRVVVGTAKDAISSLRKQKFDLMFLDLQLPDEPGDQVYKAAKQIDPGQNVIVITGYPDSEVLDRILQISPVTVLKKHLRSSS